MFSPKGLCLELYCVNPHLDKWGKLYSGICALTHKGVKKHLYRLKFVREGNCVPGRRKGSRLCTCELYE